jgi:hypothetical protein
MALMCGEWIDEDALVQQLWEDESSDSETEPMPADADGTFISALKIFWKNECSPPGSLQSESKICVPN